MPNISVTCREASAPVVRPGGAREEHRGVPLLQRLADGGPLGPELRAIGDGGEPDGAGHALVVGVPPPIPHPSEEVREAQDLMAPALKGGEGTGGAGPPLAQVGGGEHLGGLAVLPPQQGEAMVPPPPLGKWGGGGGGGRAGVPSPSPLSPSSWSPYHGQKRLVAGRRGARARGMGWGGEGGRNLLLEVPFVPVPGLAVRYAGLVHRHCPSREGVGGEELPDTPLAMPSAWDRHSAAAAGSHAIPPPPHTRVGPPATARLGHANGEGHKAITSPRSALVGCGRIDTLLPHRGSGSRVHPRGKPTGAMTAATTTTTNPGRKRQGAKKPARGANPVTFSCLGPCCVGGLLG